MKTIQTEKGNATHRVNVQALHVIFDVFHLQSTLK